MGFTVVLLKPVPAWFYDFYQYRISKKAFQHLSSTVFKFLTPDHIYSSLHDSYIFICIQTQVEFSPLRLKVKQNSTRHLPYLPTMPAFLVLFVCITYQESRHQTKYRANNPKQITETKNKAQYDSRKQCGKQSNNNNTVLNFPFQITIQDLNFSMKLHNNEKITEPLFSLHKLFQYLRISVTQYSFLQSQFEPENRKKQTTTEQCKILK